MTPGRAKDILSGLTAILLRRRNKRIGILERGSWPALDFVRRLATRSSGARASPKGRMVAQRPRSHRQKAHSLKRTYSRAAEEAMTRRSRTTNHGNAISNRKQTSPIFMSRRDVVGNAEAQDGGLTNSRSTRCC
jgi:hypothetical protein